MDAYTSFVSMNRIEGRAFLARFLSEMPASLERLTKQSEATGGPCATDLDLGPESLSALWSWAAPRFTWRRGYMPSASRGAYQPPFQADDLEPPQALPAWFYHPSGHGLDRFSSDTLWLIDGIGRYLGQTVVQSIPGTRWCIGATKPKGNMLANQPVLEGLGYEVSPLITCVVSIAKTLTDWEATPSLVEAYEQYASLAKAADGAAAEES